MPVSIYNREYFDFIGNQLSYLRANAGDLVQYNFKVKESIQIQSSLSLTLEANLYLNSIETIGNVWENEGFEIGDTVTVTTYDSTTGAVIDTGTADIVIIDGGSLFLDANPVAYWNPFEDRCVITANRNRESVDFLTAFTNNGSGGSAVSLIDGSETRVRFNGLDAMTVSDVVTGATVGNASGMFEISATITREADDPDGSRIYQVIFATTQSGILTPLAFNGTGCLKLYIRQEWKTYNSNPTPNVVLVDSPQADTGWFDEAVNTETANSTLTTGITTLYYNSVQTFTVTTAGAGATTERYIGACYYPQSNYNLSKPQDQSVLCMELNTNSIALGVYNSKVNPSGASYSIEILSVTGADVQFRITFNTTFKTFIESLAIGDRRFVIWLKAGNVNHLLFDGQLEKAPIVPTSLNFRYKNIVDHSYNSTTIDESKEISAIDNTEDDVAFLGTIANLPKNVDWDRFSIGIQAFNTVTDETVDLERIDFNLSQAPTLISGAKAYNEVFNLSNNLPTTSAKRQAFFKHNGVTASSTYQVEVCYPWLYRWEYWLPKLGLPIDFFGDENFNWQSKQVGDWVLRVAMELVNVDEIRQNAFSLTDIDYDDWAYNSEIEYRIEETNTLVSGVVAGKTMRITAIHDISPEIWENDTWGMITVEPFEDAPRWIMSTVIDHDFNPNNPLTPLDGQSKATLTFPTPSIAKIECLYNPDLLGVQKVKFTSKVKSETSPLNYLITTEDEFLITDTGDNLSFEE